MIKIHHNKVNDIVCGLRDSSAFAYVFHVPVKQPVFFPALFSNPVEAVCWDSMVSCQNVTAKISWCISIAYRFVYNILMTSLIIFFVQPPKVKFKIDAERLQQFILLHGLPPKGASCTNPSGYWVNAARDLCGKEKPSYHYVKAVANYYYCDLKGVQSSVIPKLQGLKPSPSEKQQQAEEVNNNNYRYNIFLYVCSSLFVHVGMSQQEYHIDSTVHMAVEDYQVCRMVGKMAIMTLSS